jgi:hypothetical protein
MSRSTLLGFLGGIVFVVSLVAGAFAADAFRDTGGGDVQIPVAAGEPIPLIPGEDITGFDPEPVFVPDSESVPIEVTGEFVLLDEAPSAGAGRGGFSDGGPAIGGDSGDGPPAEGEPPPGGDRGYSWEVEELDFSIIDLLFGDAGFPLLRFLDFCADHPDSPGCPPGVGGTVLMPVDDHLAVGEFYLRDTLYSTRSPWWTCETPSGLRPSEYFLLVSANHPARIEIDYYPSDDPSAIQSTVVDLTNPGNRFFTDFVAEVMETGGTPVTGVHHCFVLEAGRRSMTYTVEARATSFTGETQSRTFSFRSQEQRSRPPVQLAPLSDYEATLVVPMDSESRQRSVVRLITSDEGLSCSEIEDASVISRERRDVVPGDPGPPYSGFNSSERIGDDIINAPDWRYDPAYDTYAYWHLGLEEGNSYRVCIWWVESPDRSYDPVHTGIVGRETRYITMPDRLRAQIRVAAIQAPSDRDVTSGSFSLTARSRCPRLELPTRDLDRGTGVAFVGGLPLCDYSGYRQPASTELTATLADGTTKDFVVATPNTGEPRIERVRLDLSVERGSGLCGSSFGDCDSPTSTVPGPIVYLDLVFEEGDGGGRPDWIWGEPFAFEPPPREAPEVPDQPRMDRFSSQVVGVRRDALLVTVNFDRPVTLRASLEGDPTEQCLAGEAPTFSSDGLRASYSFEMDGLCTYTDYRVRLEVTDEAGSTLVFTTLPPSSPGEYGWAGGANTLGYDVSYQVNYRSFLVDPFAVHAFAVRVNGRSTIVGGDHQCLRSTTSPFRSQTWGELISVQIDVLIADGDEVDGRCRSSRFAAYFESSVTASFTIEEFMAGPIEIGITPEAIAPSTARLPSTPIRVIIQGSVVP